MTFKWFNPIFPSLCGVRGDIGLTEGGGRACLPSGVEPITRLFDKLTTGVLVSTPSRQPQRQFCGRERRRMGRRFMTNGTQGGAKPALPERRARRPFSASHPAILSAMSNRSTGYFCRCRQRRQPRCFAVTWYGRKLPLLRQRRRHLRL